MKPTKPIMRQHLRRLVATLGLTAAPCLSTTTAHADSIARVWNEQLLDAISLDTARPTVHARNLYHLSAAMYDAWAAYDTAAAPVFHNERATAANIEQARSEAISYAAYRVIKHRFTEGPGGTGPGRLLTGLLLDQELLNQGFDPLNTSTVDNTPAALGNRIAQSVINAALLDGANEANNYADPTGYQTVNPPLVFDNTGSNATDPNRWQPLQFVRERRDQFGTIITQQVQSNLTPYWGNVQPFALTQDQRNPVTNVYHDQGAPPQLGGAGDAELKQAVNHVLRLSSQLDPTAAPLIDISPGALGNSPLGSYDQLGHGINPVTGQPYAQQWVNQADYARITAEYWADGPNSTAPPGHWNEITNAVADKLDALGQPRTLGGTGPAVSNLEWDIKAYLAVNGAVHDAGITAWNHKGHYDSSRPITLIRYMGQRGQSSDPNLVVDVNGSPVNTYDPQGLALEPGLVEVITPETTAAGQRHAHLAGHEGKVAILSWLGPPDAPVNDPTDIGGVDWALSGDWLPYQLDSFVSPPFAGLLSGHSTFSRSAAEVLTALTGSAYFPGGIYESVIPQGTGIEFEFGPTAPVTLQWATFYDAADAAGISRIYGGIHISPDDLGGRRAGALVGQNAWAQAQRYFDGSIIPEPIAASTLGLLTLLTTRQRTTRRR